MIVALIDNGSLEPAVHRNLRAVAAALSARVGIKVHAVSWRYSDRIAAEALDGARAWTVDSFVRAMYALGQREFVFVPFFISPQGAIGSALYRDLEDIGRPLGDCEFRFADGLAAHGVIPRIVAARIRETLAVEQLRNPPVIVVDHGGPSVESAQLRNSLAVEISAELAAEIGPLAAASLEGEDHAHNWPLFAGQLTQPEFDRGDVVVAPLFLSPGRHAGPDGDLAQIARAANTAPGASKDPLASTSPRCHFTELVGTHPLVADALAEALRESLSPLHA